MSAKELPTPQPIKACWWCKHFIYTQADSGWSEYTPGWSFGMCCNKNYWSFDAFTDSQGEFGAKLQTAETCPDFQVEVRP